MTDRVALGSPAHIAQLETKIQVLSQRLAEAEADVAQWKINFDVHVEPLGNTYQILITGKSGRRGFRKILAASDVNLVNTDTAALTKQIASEYVHALNGESAFNDLITPLSRAIMNVQQLTTQKSSL